MAGLEFISTGILHVIYKSKLYPFSKNKARKQVSWGNVSLWQSGKTKLSLEPDR